MNGIYTFNKKKKENIFSSQGPTLGKNKHTWNKLIRKTENKGIGKGIPEKWKQKDNGGYNTELDNVALSV